MKLNANKFQGGGYFIIDGLTGSLLGHSFYKSIGAATRHWKVEVRHTPSALIKPVADAQLYLLQRGF